MTARDEGPKDLFEERYMKAPGVELRRERTIWRWHWIILAPALWTFAGMVLTLLAALPGASAAVAAFLGLMTAFFALLWAAFLVLRVVVTDREVHVQYGLWGPKVDLAAIIDCKVVDYDWKRFGGWGIKRDSEGTWAYTLMGEGSRVVEITWRERGEVKRAVVSSRTPDELVAAIVRAKTERSPAETSATNVRVTPSEAPAEEPVETLRGDASDASRNTR